MNSMGEMFFPYSDAATVSHCFVAEQASYCDMRDKRMCIGPILSPEPLAIHTHRMIPELLLFENPIERQLHPYLPDKETS